MFSSVIKVEDVKKLNTDRIEKMLEFYQYYINLVISDFNKRIIQVYSPDYDCFEIGCKNLPQSNVQSDIPQSDKLIIANKLSELLSQSGWKLVKSNFTARSYSLGVTVLSNPIINETELDLK